MKSLVLFLVFASTARSQDIAERLAAYRVETTALQFPLAFSFDVLQVTTGHKGENETVVANHSIGRAVIGGAGIRRVDLTNTRTTEFKSVLSYEHWLIASPDVQYHAFGLGRTPTVKKLEKFEALPHGLYGIDPWVFALGAASAFDAGPRNNSFLETLRTYYRPLEGLEERKFLIHKKFPIAIAFTFDRSEIWKIERVQSYIGTTNGEEFDTAVPNHKDAKEIVDWKPLETTNVKWKEVPSFGWVPSVINSLQENYDPSDLNKTCEVELRFFDYITDTDAVPLGLLEEKRFTSAEISKDFVENELKAKLEKEFAKRGKP